MTVPPLAAPARPDPEVSSHKGPAPVPLKRPAQIVGLLALIGLTGYVGLRPYFQYGLNAAHIDEMDPFRVAHGAELNIPNDLVYKGAEKDRIPSLTRPKFISAAQAPEWLHDDARIIGVVHNSVAKAYPILIMLWHEAVNDEVGGKPYLVTY